MQDAATTKIDYQQNSETPSNVSEKTLARVQKSYLHFLELSQTQKIYGLHTHYGFNVVDTIAESDWLSHQKLLLDYLCVGVGTPLAESTVRRALQLQVKKLGQGMSAIHPETFVGLCNYSQQMTMPKVPRYGSLGASGDLVTMAHAVQPYFAEAGIKGPRDVISCVNTNSMMCAFALELLPVVKALLDISITATALNVSGSASSNEPYLQTLLKNGANSSYTLEISDIIQERLAQYSNFQNNSLLQQRYSLRCAPQVLAHCLRELNEATQLIMDESEALADNPILPLDDKSVRHGGLFYAIGIASAADRMTEVCFRLCEMMDRQILVMMDTTTNGGLAANLASPGEVHLKGIHQLASSLMQRVRGLAQPSRFLSFSCEGNNQDIVPCGMTALIQLEQLIQLTQDILKAALFVGLRAESLRTNKEILHKLKIKQWAEVTTPELLEYISNLKNSKLNNNHNKGENYEFR